MSKSAPIKEVYIDHTELMKHPSERGLEALEILTERLGKFAIDRVDEPKKADAMIVLGGDGTFLKSMHEHDFPEVPIIGVNTGTLGFLMNISPEEAPIRKMVKRMAKGKYKTKSWPLLEVPVGSEGDTELAINDIVVGNKDRDQAFKASLRIGEDGVFDHFVGDGFIFSTPQGSTSYSLSAGGPVLQEGLSAYVVTPSNPHISKHYCSLPRPVVVDGSDKSTVGVKEIEKRPFRVSADGRALDKWFEEDDGQVEVRLSNDKSLSIIRFAGYDYFNRVSDAFGGRQPVDE